MNRVRRSTWERLLASRSSSSAHAASDSHPTSTATERIVRAIRSRTHSWHPPPPYPSELASVAHRLWLSDPAKQRTVRRRKGFRPLKARASIPLALGSIRHITFVSRQEAA